MPAQVTNLYYCIYSKVIPSTSSVSQALKRASFAGLVCLHRSVTLFFLLAVFTLFFTRSDMSSFVSLTDYCYNGSFVRQLSREASVAVSFTTKIPLYISQQASNKLSYINFFSRSIFLTNYFPRLLACGLFVYVCFFVKKFIRHRRFYRDLVSVPPVKHDLIFRISYLLI